MNEKIFTISANKAAAIVNVLAYEDYARLKRRYMTAGIDDRPSFEAFYAECNKTLEMNMLPYEAWKCGYYLIAGLFDDNERNGTPCDEEARFNQAVGALLAMFNNRK
jgi:hypothetical protein